MLTAAAASLSGLLTAVCCTPRDTPCARRIPKEQYFPVPGVDGALVTFKLLPPGKRRPVPGERGFISMVRCGCVVVAG
jgi:hypothetical protein